MNLFKLKNILIVFICTNCLASNEKITVYKFLPGTDGLRLFYQPNLCGMSTIEIDQVDSLVFLIKGEETIKTNDIIILYHNAMSASNNTEVVDFTLGRQDGETNIRKKFTDIRRAFSLMQNKDYYRDRVISLINPDLIHKESLSLNYNESRNQIIDDDVTLTDANSLYDKSMYIKLRLENTDDVYVKQSETGPIDDAFKVIDMDKKNNKPENIPRSNLNPNAFWYTSDDEHIRDYIEIDDYKKKKKTRYEFFRSLNPKNNIPEKAKINVDDVIIDSTEIKDVVKINKKGKQKIISIKVAVTESTRLDDLDDYVYSITQPQTLLDVNSKEVKNAKNVKALIRKDHGDKHLTLTSSPLNKIIATTEDGTKREVLVESETRDLGPKEVSASTIRYALIGVSFALTILSSL
jgi:hypothetical protein